MEIYTLDRFGQMVQEINPTKIIIVHLGSGDPIFLFFTQPEQVVEYILEHHPRPFVKGIFSDNSKTHLGSLIFCSEERLEICLIQKSGKDQYRFFNSEIYGLLKSLLMDEAISWSSFIKYSH